ncbi:unnamed protein product [Protopolystoma xenopodis]|uniref:Uncharacterized protein n=1 Tax=Protopolystoma xenopodis TaxID=117903 RepID=A0A448WCM7_9PLAT|nr:unnamed protein product [Protopolystoma xenopodis]
MIPSVGPWTWHIPRRFAGILVGIINEPCYSQHQLVERVNHKLVRCDAKDCNWSGRLFDYSTHEHHIYSAYESSKGKTELENFSSLGSRKGTPTINQNPEKQDILLSSEHRQSRLEIVSENEECSQEYCQSDQALDSENMREARSHSSESDYILTSNISCTSPISECSSLDLCSNAENEAANSWLNDIQEESSSLIVQPESSLIAVSTRALQTEVDDFARQPQGRQHRRPSLAPLNSRRAHRSSCQPTIIAELPHSVARLRNNLRDSPAPQSPAAATVAASNSSISQGQSHSQSRLHHGTHQPMHHTAHPRPRPRQPVMLQPIIGVRGGCSSTHTIAPAPVSQPFSDPSINRLRNYARRSCVKRPTLPASRASVSKKVVSSRPLDSPFGRNDLTTYHGQQNRSMHSSSVKMSSSKLAEAGRLVQVTNRTESDISQREGHSELPVLDGQTYVSTRKM